MVKSVCECRRLVGTSTRGFFSRGIDGAWFISYHGEKDHHYQMQMLPSGFVEKLDPPCHRTPEYDRSSALLASARRRGEYHHGQTATVSCAKRRQKRDLFAPAEEKRLLKPGLNHHICFSSVRCVSTKNGSRSLPAAPNRR